MSGWIRCSRYLAWWTALFSDGVVQPHFLGHVKINLQEMFSANLNHLKSSSIAGKWCFMPHVSRHIKTLGDGGESCVAWAEHKSSWQKGIPTAKLHTTTKHISCKMVWTPSNKDTAPIQGIWIQFRSQLLDDVLENFSRNRILTYHCPHVAAKPSRPWALTLIPPVLSSSWIPTLWHVCIWQNESKKLKLFHGCPRLSTCPLVQRTSEIPAWSWVHTCPLVSKFRDCTKTIEIRQCGITVCRPVSCQSQGHQWHGLAVVDLDSVDVRYLKQNSNQMQTISSWKGWTCMPFLECRHSSSSQSSLIKNLLKSIDIYCVPVLKCLYDSVRDTCYPATSPRWKRSNETRENAERAVIAARQADMALHVVWIRASQSIDINSSEHYHLEHLEHLEHLQLHWGKNCFKHGHRGCWTFD